MASECWFLMARESIIAMLAGRYITAVAAAAALDELNELEGQILA